MLATLGIIQSNIKFTGLLDTYSGAAAAYSLRKLRNAYSGSAIRVRRSSDNTEQDIGFDGNGNLDESALITFVGANSGYVVKWYDQSGNARNASNSTSSSQPRIVNAGTVDKLNNKPAIYFDSTDDNLIITNSSSIDLQIKTITTVSKANATSNFQGLYDKWTGGNPSLGYMLDYSSSSNLGKPRFTSAGPTSSGTSIQSSINANNIQSLITAIINDSSSSLTVNGTTTTGTLNTSNGNSDNLYINGDGASTLRTAIYFHEFNMWNTDQSSNRTGIESNINTYYSIY